MAKKTDSKKQSKVNGAKNRRIGAKYELKIIKELNDLYETNSLVSTRSESKRLDNLGVDVADKENVLPFYVQCKNTKSTPPVELISQAKVTDKPLVIFWNKRVQRNENCISGGEFVFVSKQFFYNLIKDKKNEGNQD